jgi:hypothetical protein
VQIALAAVGALALVAGGASLVVRRLHLAPAAGVAPDVTASAAAAQPEASVPALDTVASEAPRRPSTEGAAPIAESDAAPAAPTRITGSATPSVAPATSPLRGLPAVKGPSSSEPPRGPKKPRHDDGV